MSTLLSKKVIILLIIAVISIAGVVVISQSGGGTKYYMALGSTGSVNKDYYLELGDDGSFLLNDLNMNVSGTYEISGNTITLKPGQGLSTKKGKIDGNTITDPEGQKWVKQ